MFFGFDLFCTESIGSLASLLAASSRVPTRPTSGSLQSGDDGNEGTRTTV